MMMEKLGQAKTHMELKKMVINLFSSIFCFPIFFFLYTLLYFIQSYYFKINILLILFIYRFLKLIQLEEE